MPTGANKAKQQPPTKQQQTDKQNRIDAEVKRLLSSFNDVPEETMNILDGLVKEAAYMRITLEEWKADLDATGWVELFQQSDKVAPYEKKRPKAEMYLNLNPNYQKIMGKLVDYMPKPDSVPKDSDDDGFDDFLGQK